MNSKILSASLSLLFSVVITGCSGGGGGDTDTTAQGATDTVIALQAITGGATKGPLTNANVAVYALSFDGGPVQVSSTAVDTGSTSGQAKIQDLALPFPLNPPYLLKFTATASTKDLSTCTNPADLSTCFAPILNTMSTVITSKMLAAGQNIYATPLTSMATNIALKQAATDATQFKANLSTAAKQVASTLGFGMSSRIDIFNTPPLVDETTDTTDELGDTASYRSAIEAVGAVVHEIQQNSTATDATSVLDELSDDLAFDGVIDGQTASGTSEVVTSNTLQVFEQEPTTLVIPNSGGTTVAAVTTELATESTATGATVDTVELASVIVVVEPAEASSDIDDDGVLNTDDAYPEDATADTDTDGDGAPDIAYTDASRTNEDNARSDMDDDNDGWLDSEDDYTTDVTRFLNPDLDRDGDSVNNGVDNCPLTINADQADTDGNGQGDACSNDNDGDGIDDAADNCPLVANPSQTDTGGSTDGDACDINIDGDSADNTVDAFPYDPTEIVDTDGDGTGNNADTDDDNDGVQDVSDTGVAPAGAPSEGTACSLLRDCDGDGYLDGVDLDPLNPAITINYAPVANVDTATTNEDTLVSITVLSNDTDSNTADTLTVSAVGTASNGSVAINGNNVDYTPATDFNGADSFSYTVSDGTATATAIVTVTVNAVNDAPVVGAAGPFSIAENVANAFVVGSVTATDVDDSISGYSITGGNTGSAFAISAAGQITVADTTAIDYETASSFSLSITATDGVNTSAAQSVVVNITDVNDTAPVVSAAGPFSIAEDVADTTVVGSVSATDVDGSVTGYSITAGNTGSAFAISAAGQITVADTTAIDYESATSFSLSITATDGVNTSAAQSVVVNITDVNDTAPVVSAAGPFSIAEDVADTTVVGSVSATDVDGSVTGYSITAGNTGNAFAISAAGQITVANTTAIDYESATSFTLSITATDGTNTSAAQSVVVNITDVNDTAPVVSAAGPFTVAENVADTTVVGSVSATDVDGSVTGYSITAGNTGNAFAISAAGVISVADTTAIDYESATSFTLSITATDGVNTSAAQSVVVNITDVNDTAPVVSAAGPFTVAENVADATVVGSVSATDVDGSVTGYSIIAGNTGSAFAISVAGQITVANTTAIDYESATSFTLSITATDGTNTSAAQSVVVNISDVNDSAPVVATGQTFSVIETATNGTVIGTVSASDADSTGGITGFSISGTVFAIDASGQITVADNTTLQAASPHTVTVDATDGVNTSAAVSVVITAVNNQPPVANPDTAVTNEETAITTVDVTANDTDAEGDSLTATLLANASNGNVVDNGNNTFTYTPAANFAGIDTFTYTVSDAISTDVGTVTITVNSVNDNPSLVIDSLTTDEDTAGTTIDVTLNDTDVDGDVLTTTLWAASPANGTVVDNGDNTFTYTPNQDFNGSDTFYYAAYDGNGGSAWTTVNVTVNAVNDAPVAVADATSTSINTAVTTGSVLSNDSDVDGDTLTVVAGNPTAANGTVVNHGDGTFTYTPATDYTGTDSFTYSVTDSSLTSTATVTVTVNPAGTVIDMLTLMSASEGGAAGVESYGPNNYEYWTDNYDSVGGLFSFGGKQYNHATGLFEATVDDNDLLLSGGLWVSLGNIHGTSDGLGGLNLSIRNANDDAVEVASFKLNARYIDITGEPIANYLDAVWQGAMINSNAVFNTGAKLISSYTFEALSDAYWLSQGDWCMNDGTSRYVDLNNNCEAVDVDVSINSTGYAQTLDEVIAATAWVDPDDSSKPAVAIQIAWNDANNTSLTVELVNDGSTNYYVIDWNNANPALVVAAPVIGTNWVRNSTPGVEMIQVQVPASLVAQFPDDLDEGLNYFVTVQNGFVRKGQKSVTGEIQNDSGMINGNALSDILGNFSAPAVIDCTTTGGPYSYVDFATVIADCGTQPFTDADLIGNTFVMAGATNEESTFNAGGTGTFTSDGGVNNYPFSWSIDGNGYLTITDNATFVDQLVAYGIDTATGGVKVKAYTEGDNVYAGDGVFDATADGEIWEDIVIPAGASASLACDYSTPWDDINDQPADFNSYDDFNTVVTACGGVLALTPTDMVGTWIDTWTETNGDVFVATMLFNADQSTGTYTETLNGVQTGSGSFVWSVVNNLLTVGMPGVFMEVTAVTASGQVHYSEDSQWTPGSDLDITNTTTLDGEIWHGDYVKQ